MKDLSSDDASALIADLLEEDPYNVTNEYRQWEYFNKNASPNDKVRQLLYFYDIYISKILMIKESFGELLEDTRKSHVETRSNNELELSIDFDGTRIDIKDLVSIGRVAQDFQSILELLELPHGVSDFNLEWSSRSGTFNAGSRRS